MEQPADNNNKEQWCEYGNACETEFIIKTFNAGLGIYRNPLKKDNKFTHDFFITLPCDLKTIRNKWIYSDSMFGIDSLYAISINEKDIVRYRALYPHIILIFDLEYEGYKGIHYAPLFQLERYIALKKAKRHEYKTRQNLSDGNAKTSYIFDIRWFPKLGEAF